jgi:signal transduction histidine kinase
MICVSDSGIGIPEEDQPRLFEPFHRAHNVNNIPGTGLGLPITKQAVELHGGDITVETGSGGTTFIIHLPLNRDS